MDIVNGMILPFFTSGIKIRVNLMTYQWKRYCELDDFTLRYIWYPNKTEFDDV
jgi:hypothetical protein